jgi:hypothetical protein
MAKRKDRSKLLGMTKLRSSRKPYYYQVYLWRDIQNLRDHFDIPDDEETLAITCFEPWFVDTDTGGVYINPKLGELHFAVGNWSLNIVAHEVQHAVVHRMRLLWPPAHLILLDEYTDAEEEIAYETGHWVERTYQYLVATDAGGPATDLRLPTYISPIRWPRTGLRLIKKDDV